MENESDQSLQPSQDLMNVWEFSKPISPETLKFGQEFCRKLKQNAKICRLSNTNPAAIVKVARQMGIDVIELERFIESNQQPQTFDLETVDREFNSKPVELFDMARKRMIDDFLPPLPPAHTYRRTKIKHNQKRIWALEKNRSKYFKHVRGEDGKRRPNRTELLKLPTAI